VAKYKSFDEYVKGEKIVRYTEWFKLCWDFATEAAEEKATQKQVDVACQAHELTKVCQGCIAGCSVTVRGSNMVAQNRSGTDRLSYPACASLRWERVPLPPPPTE